MLTVIARLVSQRRRESKSEKPLSWQSLSRCSVISRDSLLVSVEAQPSLLVLVLLNS